VQVPDICSDRVRDFEPMNGSTTACVARLVPLVVALLSMPVARAQSDGEVFAHNTSAIAAGTALGNEILSFKKLAVTHPGADSYPANAVAQSAALANAWGESSTLLAYVYLSMKSPADKALVLNQLRSQLAIAVATFKASTGGIDEVMPRLKSDALVKECARLRGLVASTGDELRGLLGSLPPG
jgi:hypothetical protein